jgi:uncharacterized protein
MSGILGRTAVVALATLMLPGAAARGAGVAPSFPCDQATTWVEKAVCADAELAAADVRLGALFAEARREMAPTTKELLAAQRQWLATREECRTEAAVGDCLKGLYERRSGELAVGMPALAGARLPLTTAAAERILGVFDAMTPEDLYAATTSENRDALSDASCLYFQRSPRAAGVLFAANFYSSKDSWSALCGTLDVVRQVPATEGLLATLEAMEGASGGARCLGTMQSGVARHQAVTRILVVADPAPDVAAYEKDHLPNAQLSYKPDVAHWSLQGLWEKRRYADLAQAVAQARPALAAEYERRFHLDAAHAGRLADFNIRRLVDVYTGSSGASSTSWYPSLCFDLADLDAWLRSGKVPAKPCPDAASADPSPRANLGRLLGLAVIDGYPLPAVKQLIAAGARLDPPLPVHDDDESAESPLMMAAARTEVIDALLAGGADPNRGNSFGKTALMYAVQERNLAGVHRLLQGGARVDAATAEDLGCTALAAGRRTALMYAAWQSTPAIVQALLDAHADRSLADTDGKTAAAYLAKNSALSPAERHALEALLGPPPTAPAKKPAPPH